jgi:hypothetical protein
MLIRGCANVPDRGADATLSIKNRALRIVAVRGGQTRLLAPPIGNIWLFRSLFSGFFEPLLQIRHSGANAGRFRHLSTAAAVMASLKFFINVILI